MSMFFIYLALAVIRVIVATEGIDTYIRQGSVKHFLQLGKQVMLPDNTVLIHSLGL